MHAPIFLALGKYQGNLSWSLLVDHQVSNPEISGFQKSIQNVSSSSGSAQIKETEHNQWNEPNNSKAKKYLHLLQLKHLKHFKIKVKFSYCGPFPQHSNESKSWPSWLAFVMKYRIIFGNFHHHLQYFLLFKYFK